MDTQEDSLLLESEAHEAVLEMVGEGRWELSELEVV